MTCETILSREYSVLHQQYELWDFLVESVLHRRFYKMTSENILSRECSLPAELQNVQLDSS